MDDTLACCDSVEVSRWDLLAVVASEIIFSDAVSFCSCSRHFFIICFLKEII